MTIAGAGISIVRLIEREYRALHGGLNGLSFDMLTTANLVSAPTNKVSLFLYRVEVDPTRRHQDLPPVHLGSPPRRTLGVDLRYLLTVWVGDAELEHQILQDCIDILERNAIVSGTDLASGYGFQSSDALKVAFDSISNEDMMRLWDLLEPSYRLSIPYLVRTVKLATVEEPVVPLVTSRVYKLSQRVE